MRGFILLMILLSNISLNTQMPKIDMNFKKDMIARKARHYQQLMLCESLKTANQENFDITYYSLDLTPDPVTAILDGIVELVGEVTALTLNHIELKFWDGMSVADVHCFDTPGVQLYNVIPGYLK